MAWYVNNVVKKRFYVQEMNERRLKELYRPMDIILKASKSAFQRYLDTDPDADREERQFLAGLWYDYNTQMKDLIMKNGHLFIEPDLPSEIDQLIRHIDTYFFVYRQYKQGKIDHPFVHDFPFPRSIEDYFASRSRKLATKIESDLG